MRKAGANTLRNLSPLEKFKKILMTKMKEEPKKWSLFDIVGLYSSGVKLALKATKAPMETTV